MDSSFKFPASPGTPLFQVSPERVNQQRPQFIYEPDSDSASIHELSESRSRHARESSVHDRVSQFNSLAFQGKQLERKTNDAALKRAMVGREEAETEMRRYREETKALKAQVIEEESKTKKVSERLENYMEQYQRLREHHDHTQAAWEKEIRRARKEAFKTQSGYVKLQEELKSSRNAAKATQADLEQEKERSAKREQEAFEARYQLVGVQEELARALEKVKLVEQERDALRTIAKNEEVARIAAEGRIPLPRSTDDDEFASPKKARMSLDPIMITSSAASEEELDDLRMLLEWEKQRADRAHDRVEFLEIECRLNCCISRAARNAEPEPISAPVPISEPEKEQVVRSETIFVPAEGVFRTVSPLPEESPWISPAKKAAPVPDEPPRAYFSYARTPSCEPPSAAIIPESNTSLLSLLDAPHSPQQSIKEEPEEEPETPSPVLKEAPESEDDDESNTTVIQTYQTISTTTRIPLANPVDLTPQTTLPTNPSNPALSPTMSREEALAMIRERRGRARSLAQGTLTPRKQMVEGGVRRDISAPAIRSANTPRGRSQVQAA